MIRAQAEHRPNIPPTFEALSEMLMNDPELGRTLDRESDLFQGMVGEVGHRSIIFSSRRVIDGVYNLRHLFGDATFYARPRLPQSSQLYTFVTVRDNHVVPLLYALMESRTNIAYDALFHFVRNLAPNLDPEYIMTDFEAAQQAAVIEAFPRARISGCLWHYTRAVCRSVRRLGLHQLVRDSDNARMIVRLCMAIPLAPVGRLQEALNCVIVEARRLQLAHEFNAFFHYIRETWILGVSDRVLSVFGVCHRTNNVAECHHRNINARLVCRPNIWRFLDIVRELEDMAWRDLGRLEGGLPPSRARRVSSISNDARVRCCSRQILNREMDMLHFLSSVSRTLEGVLRDNLIERQNEERPPSPLRRPPPQARLPQATQNSGSTGDNIEQVCFEDEMIEPSRENDSLLNNIDSADLFHSLVQNGNDNEAGDIPQRGRTNRGSRARGRARGQARGRARGRARGQARGRSESREAVLQGGDEQAPNQLQQEPRQDCSWADSDQHPLVTSSSQSNQCDSRNRHERPCQSHNALRPENFSDEEMLHDEGQSAVRRWQECIICSDRVGHYSIIGCGAFPLCGTCIRYWFLLRGNERCPHCNGQAQGWIRLNRH